MSNEELGQLGLTAKGDQAKLRAFCRGENDLNERQEKMKKSKKIIEEGKSTRKSPVPTTTVNEKIPVPKKIPKATLKFEFRWKHAKDGGEYKLVRAGQGGGVRTKEISRYATVLDCLREAEDLFFPDGKSTKGNLEEMVVNLADFKSEEIDLMDSFKAEDYKKKYGFHISRLVLLTKEKFVQVEDESGESVKSDDEELETSVWDRPTYSLTSDYLPVSVTQQHSLIGTSEERQKLHDSVDKEYEASFAVDKAKREIHEAEERAITRRHELRSRRERRIPPEPDKTQPHVVISVRHPQLGVQSRAFTEKTKMQGVYDWIGAFSSSPEHFCLNKAYPRKIVYPDEDVSLYAFQHCV